MADFEYRKLRGRIIEKFGTISNFADTVGLTPAGVSKKLTGKAQFNQDDIIHWCDLLEINLEEAIPYFFG